MIKYTITITMQDRYSTLILLGLINSEPDRIRVGIRIRNAVYKCLNIVTVCCFLPTCFHVKKPIGEKITDIRTKKASVEEVSFLLEEGRPECQKSCGSAYVMVFHFLNNFHAS
jgi:hypothetical protein